MALSKLTKVQTLGIGSNIEVVGVITTGQFKSGTSNLHSTGVELTNLNVSGIATIGGNVTIGGTLTYQDVTNIDSVGLITARAGVNVSGGQLDVGSNIKIGNAGVITATSFVGSGANLTGITQTTINSNTNNYLITGTGTANTLQGEANLTFDGNDLTITGVAPCVNLTDTDSDDYKISNTQGVLAIRDTTAGADRFVINDNGTGYFQSNFLVGGTTTSPGATFHVKNSYASVKIDSDGANNDVNLYFKIGANKKNIINFGDNDDTDIGQIFYDHNGDYMSFKTNTSEKLRITSTGQLLLSQSNTDTTLNNWAGATLNIKNTSNTDNNKSVIYFSNSAGGTDSAIQGIHEDADGTGSARRGFLSFGTSGSNSSGSVVERLRIASNGDFGFNDTSPTANASGNDTVLSIKGKGSSYSGKIDFKDSSGNIDNHIASDNAIFMFNCDPNSQNGNTSMLFSVHGSERFRFGRHGQLGIAGANYGAARQVMVSNGSGSAVSWSSNPFLLDMDSLGDLDYDGVFLRYREVNVSGNGLVYLGLCKSTTNCPAGRIGCPVGYVPGVVYNSQFRVDKVGITPWPDGSGHRYEYFAIISDYVSAGKLGIFYLTNSTN